jgi:ubiquitin carboxyl-terminal hydrolase 5/13
MAYNSAGVPPSRAGTKRGVLSTGAPAQQKNMPTEGELGKVRGAMRGLTPAGAYDRVCNDECAFSFDTPFSPEGLYVSLKSFQGFGKQHVHLDHERTGNRLYVHFKHTKVVKPPPTEEEAATAPTKLGIGVAGGFALGEDKYDVVKEHALVLLGAGGVEDVCIALPCAELPELVIQACTSLINHTSHLAQESNAAVAWEIETKPSKYADELIQLPAHKKISPDPKEWVCEESGMRENLWLNLSDGHIGSGRRQWDGSGGTNGALDHYTVTRTTCPPDGFPLVVKLGTITCATQWLEPAVARTRSGSRHAA